MIDRAERYFLAESSHLLRNTESKAVRKLKDQKEISHHNVLHALAEEINSLNSSDGFNQNLKILHSECEVGSGIWVRAMSGGCREKETDL